eukprot:m.740058 g.740058  ORF g.740058 m.740058 type:complete len:746 (+) comp23111_c0_seq13:292-2529(+)
MASQTVVGASTDTNDAAKSAAPRRIIPSLSDQLPGKAPSITAVKKREGFRVAVRTFKLSTTDYNLNVFDLNEHRSDDAADDTASGSGSERASPSPWHGGRDPFSKSSDLGSTMGIGRGKIDVASIQKRYCNLSANDDDTKYDTDDDFIDDEEVDERDMDAKTVHSGYFVCWGPVERDEAGCAVDTGDSPGSMHARRNMGLTKKRSSSAQGTSTSKGTNGKRRAVENGGKAKTHGTKKVPSGTALATTKSKSSDGAQKQSKGTAKPAKSSKDKPVKPTQSQGNKKPNANNASNRKRKGSDSKGEGSTASGPKKKKIVNRNTDQTASKPKAKKKPSSPSKSANSISGPKEVSKKCKTASKSTKGAGKLGSGNSKSKPKTSTSTTKASNGKPKSKPKATSATSKSTGDKPKSKPKSSGKQGSMSSAKKQVGTGNGANAPSDKGESTAADDSSTASDGDSDIIDDDAEDTGKVINAKAKSSPKKKPTAKLVKKPSANATAKTGKKPTAKSMKGAGKAPAKSTVKSKQAQGAKKTNEKKSSAKSSCTMAESSKSNAKKGSLTGKSAPATKKEKPPAKTSGKGSGSAKPGAKAQPASQPAGKVGVTSTDDAPDSSVGGRGSSAGRGRGRSGSALKTKKAASKSPPQAAVDNTRPVNKSTRPPSAETKSPEVPEEPVESTTGNVKRTAADPLPKDPPTTTPAPAAADSSTAPSIAAISAGREVSDSTDYSALLNDFASASMDAAVAATVEPA